MGNRVFFFLGAKWPLGEAAKTSTLVPKLKMSGATPCVCLHSMKKKTLQLYPYFHANMIFGETAVYMPLSTYSEKHAFSHSCMLTIDANLSCRI